LCNWAIQETPKDSHDKSVSRWYAPLNPGSEHMGSVSLLFLEYNDGDNRDTEDQTAKDMEIKLYSIVMHKRG